MLTTDRDTDTDEPDRFYQVSGLSMTDSALLIDALDKAGIGFDAEFIQEPPSVELEGNSGETAVIITVEAEDRESVRRIEVTLFGR